MSVCEDVSAETPDLGESALLHSEIPRQAIESTHDEPLSSAVFYGVERIE